MATVKIKRRKLKIGLVFITIIILGLVVYLGYFEFNTFINTKIKNIYVIGNEMLKDHEIMELAKIENYPRILSITSNEMERRIKLNPYIKDVEVKKRIGNQVYIYVTEYEQLFYNNITKKLVLEKNKELVSESNFDDVPILTNEITDTKVYEKLVNKFSKIESNIKQKISEIKYVPNDVDKERFLLSMNDGNYVYITLTKIDEINYYLEIIPRLENKKGILYLDSGKYFEIIE